MSASPRESVLGVAGAGAPVVRVSWTVDARMVQRVGARTRHERHGVYVLRVSDRRMDDLGTLWEGDAREDVTRAWACLLLHI